MHYRRTNGFLLAALLSLATVPVAYAASGWYLLVPPQSRYNPDVPIAKGHQVFLNAPLSQWDQDSAYDSAAACQKRQTAMIDEAMSMFDRASTWYAKALKAANGKADPDGLKSLRKNAAWDSAYVTRATYSRCIKSDDPRLVK
jgi:hypothetical protein